MIKKFSYKEYTFKIETTDLFVLQTITLLKNNKELDKITDAFIVSFESMRKLKKMLSFFDEKTQKEIKKFLDEMS